MRPLLKCFEAKAHLRLLIPTIVAGLRAEYDKRTELLKQRLPLSLVETCLAFDGAIRWQRLLKVHLNVQQQFFACFCNDDELAGRIVHPFAQPNVIRPSTVQWATAIRKL